MIKFKKKIVEDLNTLYHGSGDKFSSFHNEINWLSDSYDYAKYYALSLRDNGYIYECSTSLDNLFNIGKTDFRVYDLIPLKTPYNRSQKFLLAIKSLNLSSDELTQLLDDVQQEWKLEANGYRTLCSTVVRSRAFKKVLISRGYRGVKAIEFDKTTNEYVNTYGIFYGSEIKIKDIKEVSRLDENKAITWGDLNVAKKTDTRKMMGGRGTGHFGTGFYFVGANGPYGLNGDKFYDYMPERPIYEIDLDKYNLFKPSSNEEAYKIHSAMRDINNYYSDDMYDFLVSGFDVNKIEDELYNLDAKAREVYEDFNEDDLDLDDLEDVTNDLEDDELEIKDAQDKLYEKKYKELVLEFIKKYGLEDYLYGNFNSVEDYLNSFRGMGFIEREVKEAIKEKEKYLNYVNYALEKLASIFSIDKYKLLDLIRKFSRMNSEDTISTLLFKELGYEGVDVTHLNKDAQGLSGLDNFSYGTVIYDLKPGTFKKIKEPRKLKEDVEKENILDALDKEFGQEGLYMWSTYILPNGHFLNPDNSDYWDEIGEDPQYEHCDFEDWAYQKGYKNIQDIYNNCVKMNVTYPYLGMPTKARWTPEQQQSIRKILARKDLFENEEPWDGWLDAFGDKMKNMGPNVLAIFTPMGDDVFDLDVSSDDDIIKAINRAYTRGSFDESLKKMCEAIGENTFIYKGRKAWCGVVNTLDGEIEEVHTYKQAQNVGFHHSFLFSDSQLDKMDEGDSCYFVVYPDHTIYLNATNRFNTRGDDIELNEKFLEKRVREQIKFIDNESLNEYLDKVDNYSGTDIYMTDDVYKLKNLLLKGDKTYRIYHWKGDYCFCDALGDMTHNGMMQFLFDKGYANGEGFDEWSDENYMVFIPKNFDTDLMTYDTSLGSDNYYYCRVYDFGVMFVRDYSTYNNSLFSALGTPEREIFYNEDEGQVEIDKDGETKIINARDLFYNVNDAITMNLDEELELNEAKEDRLKFINWIKGGVDKSLLHGDVDKWSEKLADKFINLKSRLKSPYNDFYYWMKNSNFDDFYDYIRSLEAKISQDNLTKQREKDGARLVYSDDNWKVYEITTYEASAKYGKGTKWCISGSKRWSNGEDGANYFDQYYSQDGVKFYFFINKDTKYALAVYPDNSCEIFNAEDVGIPYIPNAPVIDEIKADYRNESDSNILVNAIMNKKLPNDALKKIIQETYEDNVGYSCTIFDRNEVNDLIAKVDDMIPDGYLEYEACANGDITPEEYKRITGEEFDISLDYWDGDIPAFSGYELAAIAGDTKEEKLKSLRYTLENEAEYVVLEEDYDGWTISPLKDYTELFMWANNRCGINDWSEGDLDDFFINSLNANDLEHVHPGRLYVFPIMLANRLIWDIKHGEISSSVLNDLGLSNDYIKSLSESLKEDLNPDIISFVEKEIGTSDKPIDGPSYILPNGKFLTIWKSKIPVSKYSASGNATHRDVQQFLYANGLVKEDGWIDDPDLEKLGCIRVNGGFEEYIWLPDKRPNETQWESLLVWLDWYFRFHRKLTVGYYHYAPKTYFAEEYTTDEILKKCKEAYARGYLTEGKFAKFKEHNNLKIIRRK